MTAKSPVDIDEIFAQGTPIDEAMNEAVRQAVERHRRAGVPMAVWKDGRVVWVDADSVRLESAEDASDPPTRQ